MPSVPDDVIEVLTERVDAINSRGGLWPAFLPGQKVRVVSWFSSDKVSPNVGDIDLRTPETVQRGWVPGFSVFAVLERPEIQVARRFRVLWAAKSVAYLFGWQTGIHRGKIAVGNPLETRKSARFLYTSLAYPMEFPTCD